MNSYGEYDPYERPDAPSGYHPGAVNQYGQHVDEYGQPIDPYAEYGRAPPPQHHGGYANGKGGYAHPHEQEEEDDFGGFTGYGYNR